jgi:hypothetical protein
MAVNRYLPHVLLLPEDDANRQVATGFHLQVSPAKQRQMQVFPVAGGWTEVLQLFETEYAPEMDSCPSRYVVLLIDFDGFQNRLETARSRIPEHLTNRVFILGAWTEPEDLRRAGLGSYETIGKAMAEDCRNGTNTIWGHDLLRHNADEISRLRQRILPILFP